MPNELTNLLPRERRNALRRAYFLRLGVVTALLVTSLTVVAAVLLLPTYTFLVRTTNTKESRLASIETALASADESTLSSRLDTLSSDAATLTALARATSASAVIRGALAIPHPGVLLSGFVYTPALPASAPSAVGRNKGTLAITGTATTRNALRTYQLALQSAALALSIDLPVSAYAKDANSMFTVTLTLAP